MVFRTNTHTHKEREKWNISTLSLTVILLSLAIRKLFTWLTHFSSAQSLSHVQIFLTPWIAATRPPCPSPSPMHESEKWKWSRSVMSDPQRPHGLQPSRLLHPWDFPGRSTGVGCHCLPCTNSDNFSMCVLVSNFNRKLAFDFAADHRA